MCGLLLSQKIRGCRWLLGTGGAYSEHNLSSSLLPPTGAAHRLSLACPETGKVPCPYLGSACGQIMAEVECVQMSLGLVPQGSLTRDICRDETGGGLMPGQSTK